MRAKLVHGTNSMTWANKVLPTCMRTPRGSQPEETTPFLANEVQIGTKRNRPATRANARSRARHRSFNRTVVIRELDSRRVLLQNKTSERKMKGELLARHFRCLLQN